MNAVTDTTHADAAILEWADYCGFQEDGFGGGFQLWNLKRPLGHHPAGSTVTRATIERLTQQAA